MTARNSVLDRMRSWWRRRTPAATERAPQSEDDAGRDTGLAGSRAHGGREPDSEVSDSATTTGTADNELFVGRVAGDDLGYAGETGAEARGASDGRHARTEGTGDRPTG